MKIIPEDNLPEPEVYYLYVYNTNGYHNGKVEVLPDNIDQVFRTTILQAKHNKVKVIMTDEWDNCVFQMENGEVLFPKPQHISNKGLDNFLN
jgi:hypothetical protein